MAMQIYGIPQARNKVADIPGAIQQGQSYALERDAALEQKKVAGIVWMAGAAQYARDNYSPDVARAIVNEGKRRGVFSQETPDNPSRAQLDLLYKKARSMIGGADPRGKAPTTEIANFREAKEGGYPGAFTDYTAQNMPDNRSAPIKNYQYRQALVRNFGEASPEVRTFDNYVRKVPGLEIVEVEQSDGSKLAVLYDPQSGRQWTLRGQPISSQTPPGYNVGSGVMPPQQQQPMQPQQPQPMPQQQPPQQPQPMPQPPGPAAQPQPVPAAQPGTPQATPVARPTPPQYGVGPTPGAVETQKQRAKAAVESEVDLEQRRIQRIELAKTTVPSMANLANVITQAEDALASAVPATGNFGAWLSKWSPFPTPYDDLGSAANTIQANEAFNRLQQMRDMSKTGGALGQVSERELALLAGNYRDLSQSQSEGQYKQNLAEFKAQYQRAMRAWENYLVGEVFVMQGPDGKPLLDANGKTIPDKAAFTEYWNSLPSGTYLTPTGYKVKQ